MHKTTVIRPSIFHDQSVNGKDCESMVDIYGLQYQRYIIFCNKDTSAILFGSTLDGGTAQLFKYIISRALDCEGGGSNML